MARKRVKKLHPGQPLPFKCRPAEIIRFLSKVELVDPPSKKFKTKCWKWLAWKDKNGYGGIKVQGRRVWAHRLAMEIFRGRIDHGLQVDHRCHFTSCVNPDHLRRKGHVANSREGSAHYRNGQNGNGDGIPF